MTAASQRVVEFFRDLENPELYERVDGVPIFGPHVKQKKAPDGSWHEVVVDQERIQRIAKMCDQMERNGNLPVITPGHRKNDPKVSEEDQPPIWGYARWLQPGTFATPGGQTIKTMLGTLYLSKTQKAKDGKPANEAARTFPHRSVDFYGDNNEITGLALLRRDPELDNLGLVSYGRRPLFRYASENIMPPTDPPDAREEEVPAETPDEAAMPGEDEMTPEETATADKHYNYFKTKPEMKYMCDRYAAEQTGAPAGGGKPASPSPTNGLPAGGKKPAVPAKKLEAPMPMSRDAVPAQYARDMKKLQDELKTVKTQLAGEAREKRLLQYRRELEIRSDAGQIKDLDAEVAFTEDFTPAQFQKYLERVDANVEAAPVGRVPLAYARNGYEGSNGGQLPANGRLSDAQEEQVMQYMREHPGEGDWDKAKAAVFKDK